MKTLCPLCGLLCQDDGGSADECRRRKAWKQRTRNLGDEGLAGARPTAKALCGLLAQSERSLLWVDGADVNTMRDAIRLAQVTGVTIHCGGSTGSDLLHRVMRSEGWLGTTLAEIARQPELVITLGDSILAESPLLESHFLSPQRQIDGQRRWWHISSRQSASACHPERRIHWPRSTWYAQLTELCLRVGQPERQSAAGPDELGELAEAIQAARSSVWIWDVDELLDEVDELIVRRLLNLSRVVSRRGHCRLLALDAHAGRVTAEEVLLWLTGCTATARWQGEKWISPGRYESYALDDWQEAFDAIVIVRSLPSDRELPQLRARMVLDPAAEKPRDLPQQSSLPSDSSTATGNRESTEMQAAEQLLNSIYQARQRHLFRGDRAIALVYREPLSGTRESARDRG